MTASATRSTSEGGSGATSLSPITGLLGQLFGLDTRSKGGGVLFSPGQFDFFGEGQQFQPGQFDTSQFFAPQQTEGSFDIADAQRGLGSAVRTQAEAAETGLIEPTQDLFRQTFKEQIVPDIQAQFGASGLNQNDSDFNASLLREGALGSAGIANLAADRRLSASRAAPGFFGSLGGAEGGLRSAERDRFGGNQALNQLFGLAGINTQGQNFTRQKDFSQQLSSGVK